MSTAAALVQDSTGMRTWLTSMVLAALLGCVVVAVAVHVPVPVHVAVQLRLISERSAEQPRGGDSVVALLLLKLLDADAARL